MRLFPSPGRARLFTIIAAGISGGTASPALASDGGASLYLLGSGGPGAAVLPPIEGLFFDNTILRYSGKSGGGRQFPIGGNVVAGLEGTILADFPTLLWVPTTNFLGGTLAVGGALPLADPRVKVDVVITGPLGNQVGISRSDEAFLIGDPVLMANVGWKVATDTYVSLGTTLNVPVGHYREGELANIAFHRWAIDVSGAVSWHNPKAGWDISAKAGITFNGKNDFSDYKTGTEFHLEGAIERTFSPSFSAGIQAYWYHQLTGDSGDGAVLGPFKGRITGLGGTAAYNFRFGVTSATLRFKLFKEFWAENRLEGTSAFLSLTVPLKMNIPKAATAPAE